MMRIVCVVSSLILLYLLLEKKYKNGYTKEALLEDESTTNGKEILAMTTKKLPRNYKGPGLRVRARKLHDRIFSSKYLGSKGLSKRICWRNFSTICL